MLDFGGGLRRARMEVGKFLHVTGEGGTGRGWGLIGRTVETEGPTRSLLAYRGLMQALYAGHLLYVHVCDSNPRQGRPIR